MEAVIDAIDAELRAVQAERRALAGDYEVHQQRLGARQEALEQARELLLEHAPAATSPRARRRGVTERPKGPGADAVANLYPPGR
jgi:hypothetical protein